MKYNCEVKLIMDIVLFKKVLQLQKQISNLLYISDDEPTEPVGVWLDPSSGIIKIKDEASDEWINPIAQISIVNDDSDDTTYLNMVKKTSGHMSDKTYISTAKLFFKPKTGELNATSFNSLSDISLKENVNGLNLYNSLDIINSLNPVSFNWKDSKQKAYGFIAQEVENVLPDVVKTNNNIKSLDYIALIPFIIKAIQELIILNTSRDK